MPNDTVTPIDGMSIDADLVRRLVSEQFPQWGGRTVVPVARQGWDNRTFRLGDDLSVRLPSAAGYVAGIGKENRCLPLLAPHLPLDVPVPVATGRPSAAFPFPWSVRRWLPGDCVDDASRLDRSALARDLGGLLVQLRQAPTTGGPPAGRHSFFRGCHPGVYGDEVRAALLALPTAADVPRCQQIWEVAQRSAWTGDPVWFHGDVAVGNLLVHGDRLSAVIDFGTCGVGDPACDLVMAWTFFTGADRAIFRHAVALPDDVWQRARGWAMWKALITLGGSTAAAQRAQAGRILAEVLGDPMQ